MLLARVWERLSAGQRREIPAFSCFLSLREQELVRRLMGEETLTFFGGYPEAERAVACYLPPYLEENSLYAEGPVTCICASYFEGDCLTHRDFLGSLMGAGIKRETGGGYLCREGLLRLLSPPGDGPLCGAKSPQCGADPAAPGGNPPGGGPDSHSGDGDHPGNPGLLSFGQRHWGRLPPEPDPGGELVLSGGAAVDGLPCQKPDRQVAPGAVISLRGMGKIRLAEVKGQTRKGRISVEIENSSKGRRIAMMEDVIARINELAKKAKAEGLTPAERSERDGLRRIYLDAIRENLTAQLENTYVVDAQGNRHKLQKKGQSPEES